MELKKLTESIYYLEHEETRDRPQLAYIKGDKFSLAIDAGYSKKHVKDFYNALEAANFNKPNFTVLTHYHYDHTFGLHQIEGVSIAHENTYSFLKKERAKAQDNNYINILKQEDPCFKEEYEGVDELVITLPDITYSDKLVLNLGSVTAQIFHTPSPHSEDTTCIYIVEDKVLFLGDSTCEDYFNNCYMDKQKLKSIITLIKSYDCNYCILSHCEPLSKTELLSYLEAQYQNL